MTSTWLPRDQYLRTLPKSTAYACLYLTDKRDRPLQLKSSLRLGVWESPGGTMEPGETPWQTAVRETREETGIIIGKRCPLLLTHFLPPEESWPVSRFGLIFDGGTLTDEQLHHIVLDAGEHSEWSVRSIDEWEKEMSPRAFARLRALAEARRSGRAGYLEADS